jgi:hypothetical protein
MSDPKPDDRANERRPEANPADAAARLAELLAKPLEPPTRARDGAPVHRDIPLLRPERWSTLADAAKPDEPARPPPVSLVRPIDPPPAPVEPAALAWSPRPLAPDEADMHRPSSDAKTDEGTTDEEAIDEGAPDEATTDHAKTDDAKTEAAMAELADAMARLVDQSVRHSDAALPVDEAGQPQDELPPAEPASAPSEPTPASSDALEPPTEQVTAPADQAIQPDEAAIKPLRPAARPPDEEPAAEAPLDPAAARIVKRVRRLMLISSLTTVIGVGAIFGVIGYRIFKSADMMPPPLPLPAPPPIPTPSVAAPVPAVPTEVTLALPKDARIIMTAVAEDRLVITLDINGTIEIRTYDLKTLQPLARMGFTTVP